jgi:hypothetical protein
MDGVRLTPDQPLRECATCHRVRDVRPYGPGKSMICLECATATPEAEEACRLEWLAQYGDYVERHRVDD